MPVPIHDTDLTNLLPRSSLGGDPWATEGVPRLPATLAEQTRKYHACQRVRGLATPTDSRRALLASVLGALSLRRLGAWAVLLGLADLSEAAWRKRLRRSNAWWLWGLGALVADPAREAPAQPSARGCLLLVDATHLGQPGGTGDDWRVHLAYDCTAGRMAQVHGTDRQGGERLAPSPSSPGPSAGKTLALATGARWPPLSAGRPTGCGSTGRGGKSNSSANG